MPLDWLPRGAVLFLHGMSEHSGMYLHVISALADAGFTVLAPDQRGLCGILP